MSQKIYVKLLNFAVIFVFVSCTYQENYEFSFCDDRETSLFYIESADNVSILDENNQPVSLENEALHIENSFRFPENHSISSNFSLDPYVQISIKEISEPLSVLTFSCYSETPSCVFISPGQVLDIDIDYFVKDQTHAVASSIITYQSDSGQMRTFQAVFNLATIQAHLDLSEYACQVSCEDDGSCLFDDCIPNRNCDYSCENGQSGFFSYYPGDVWYEEKDKQAFLSYFDPSCEINVINADPPDLDISLP